MRGEIAVYDDRFTPDPSFRVFRSCDIRSKSLRREVLSALIAYDAAHPSDPRTTCPTDAALEWSGSGLAHNFAYRLGFLKSRARDVDLDNHAEGKGSLGYFIRSAWGVLKGYLKQPNNNKR